MSILKNRFRWFFFSATAILALTGAAKIVSGFGDALALNVNEPLFGIPLRYLFCLVGCLELIVAFICYFAKSIWVKTGILAWLATTFLAYRIGLNWVGYHEPCRCLGNLTAAIHVSPANADLVMKIVLGYLLIGSYANLFWLWRNRRRSDLSLANEMISATAR